MRDMTKPQKPVRIGRRAPCGPPRPCLACNDLVYPAVEVLDVSVYLDVVPAPRGGYFWFQRHHCRPRHDDY